MSNIELFSCLLGQFIILETFLNAYLSRLFSLVHIYVTGSQKRDRLNNIGSLYLYIYSWSGKRNVLMDTSKCHYLDMRYMQESKIYIVPYTLPYKTEFFFKSPLHTYGILIWSCDTFFLMHFNHLNRFWN